MATVARNAAGALRWGLPPWTIKFRAEERELPEEVDFAVVGGGFTGLAATAWLRRIDPKQSVAVFETSRIGAGSSGHTGGMTLGETAAGDMPGLKDVLGGLSRILRELHVECDLNLPRALEIGRQGDFGGFADPVDGFGETRRNARSAGGERLIPVRWSADWRRRRDSEER